MEVASFDEIAGEFNARVARIVWCTVATVDRKGRPRTRILHPIWEGSTGWIGTSRNSHKARHIEKNPYVSLSYWDQQQQQIYADCKAEWVDDPAEKQRIWDLYKSTPPPLGYDPAIIPPWSDGPNGAVFGLLKLTPWRIELSGMLPPPAYEEPRIWRA
jgi:uncharacterized pyridoxamine 5'-phosphate oxidase family protein